MSNWPTVQNAVPLTFAAFGEIVVEMCAQSTRTSQFEAKSAIGAPAGGVKGASFHPSMVVDEATGRGCAAPAIGTKNKLAMMAVADATAMCNLLLIFMMDPQNG
jgi:hypothetical protein